ncbi:MAG: thermonuclease family protein [Alphaproteobacteria bacterium]
MIFLKRMLTAIGAILLIALGGSGTQTSSTLLQGTGVVALLVGIIIIFIFGKMMLRATGCITSIIIVGGIIFFIIYAIGGFNNGFSGVPAKLKSFLGSSQGAVKSENKVSSAPMLTETMPALKKEEKKQEPQGFNPLNYPSVIAKANVIKADVLQFHNGQYVKIFGIDSPDLNQTCANRQGRSYFCGKQAAAWLKSWVMDYDVKCHIIKTDSNGNMVGVCFLGQYDIGAATVNAGWALATEGVYRAYESAANQNKKGLWQGQFYRPADWRAMSKDKGKIKVVKPKSSLKEGLFGF